MGLRGGERTSTVTNIWVGIGRLMGSYVMGDYESFKERISSKQSRIRNKGNLLTTTLIVKHYYYFCYMENLCTASSQEYVHIKKLAVVTSQEASVVA